MNKGKKHSDEFSDIIKEHPFLPLSKPLAYIMKRYVNRDDTQNKPEVNDLNKNHSGPHVKKVSKNKQKLK